MRLPLVMSSSVIPKDLSHSQQQTYRAIFSHPMSHNLTWGDLRSLFEGLGEVSDEHNGNTKFVVNGHSMVFTQNSLNSDVEAEEVVKVRHFLRSSGLDKSDDSTPGEHLLVVVDHQEARIFKSEAPGSTPQTVTPHDPHGFGKHIHNVHDTSKGQHHPVPKSFFEDITKSLSGAQQILIFGTGSGGGSAMTELMKYLQENQKELFESVVGAVSVDAQHMTEGELLAKAREFYDPSKGN